MTIESRHGTGLLVGYIGHITTLNIEHFDFYTPKEGHLCKVVKSQVSTVLHSLIITIRDSGYNDIFLFVIRSEAEHSG